MKELPILFSTPMVKAIIDGRKTMTRRVVKYKKTIQYPIIGFSCFSGSDKFEVRGFHENGEYGGSLFNLPYKTGDKLWVRETFFDARKWKHAPLFSDGPDFIYRADEDAFIGDHNWKPSLFMPKEAARIWLEVTNVRCERLQDISKEDAIAEGVESIESPDFRKYKEYTEGTFNLKFATHSFFSLWRKINGKDSVAANPWVFVYEFKRIERP